MTGARVSRVNGERRVGGPYDRTFNDRRSSLKIKEAAFETHRREVDGIRRAWEADAEAVARPFGIDWRDLPLEGLDLLVWIEPTEDGHWRWTGRTNNKGTPVVRFRTPNTEQSASRIAHRVFVHDHQPPAAAHPRCDAPFVCVLPAHRCLVCVQPA